MGEKPAGPAGILGGDHGDRSERLGGARRDVSEVAERCSDDEKGGRVDLSRCAA
jgi:hypothetical protein